MRRRSRTLRHRYGRLRKCPAGSVVQSVLLPRGKFTVEEARAWARHHKFKATKVDVTSRFIRLRQRDPKSLGRMRTIHFGSGGVEAVVGWPNCR